MTTYAVLLAALGMLAWALYVRRYSWRCKYEIGGNLTLAFQAAALLLTAPAATCTIGCWFYEVTGRRNVEDFIGHCLFICAAAATVHHALSRMLDHTRFWRHVLAVVAAAFLARLFFFVRSAGSHQYIDDYLAMPEGFNTRIYWLITCTTVIYLLGCAARIMLVLRQHPKHNRTANVYLYGAATGTIVCLAKIFDVTAPSIQIPTPIWIGCCLAVMGFAYGHATSWTARKRELVG